MKTKFDDLVRGLDPAAPAAFRGAAAGAEEDRARREDGGEPLVDHVLSLSM